RRCQIRRQHAHANSRNFLSLALPRRNFSIFLGLVQATHSGSVMGGSSRVGQRTISLQISRLQADSPGPPRRGPERQRRLAGGAGRGRLRRRHPAYRRRLGMLKASVGTIFLTILGLASAGLADEGKDDLAKKELKKFEGTWAFISIVLVGNPTPEAELKG